MNIEQYTMNNTLFFGVSNVNCIQAYDTTLLQRRDFCNNYLSGLNSTL